MRLNTSVGSNPTPAALFKRRCGLAAGLTNLLLHLTLYPYPDITKILNPSG